jgi:hypothetical protein
MAEPTHLDRLHILRDTLTQTIATCEERNLAPLAGRLQAVLAEIESIERATPKGSKVDELASKRKARRAATPSAGVAAGAGSKQRKRSS